MQCFLQLNSRVSEDELLEAFSQFGRIVDHTIKRTTNFAYIDYEDSHSATLARRAMNGALLAGSALRVEFKVSSLSLASLCLALIPPVRDLASHCKHTTASPRNACWCLLSNDHIAAST